MTIYSHPSVMHNTHVKSTDSHSTIRTLGGKPLQICGCRHITVDIGCCLGEILTESSNGSELCYQGRNIWKKIGKKFELT